MTDRLEELMSIVSEGQNSIQRREIEDYINQLQSNWNSLREWLEKNYKESQDIWYVKIINKMNELEGVYNERNN